MIAWPSPVAASHKRAGCSLCRNGLAPYNLTTMSLRRDDIFDRSVRQQIAVNRARTPTQRLLAVCGMLDAVRAMAPRTPQAADRRLAARVRREHEREQFRVQCRRWAAAERASSPAGL